MIRYTRFIALGDSFTEGVGDIQTNGEFKGWAELQNMVTQLHFHNS